MQKTPLYEQHLALNARMMEFGGWMLPVNYGSQVEEHHAGRQQSVMFDVSHMTIVDLSDTDDDSGGVRSFLKLLLANNVDRLKAPGDALYSCMLAENGGVLDDLIVYWRGGDAFRLILNAATRDKDLAWIEQQRDSLAPSLQLEVRDDLALLAVQGPQAVSVCTQVLSQMQDAPTFSTAPETIKRFSAVENNDWFVGRTGYTGEDGFEIAMPSEQAASLWHALLQAGVTPAGLGARDTLRLEAAMNLYGSDMDETVNPYESGIGWTVAMTPQDRAFIGRGALLDSLAGEKYSDLQLIGLQLEGRGVLRGEQSVFVGGRKAGQVTSGTFSPTLQASIAFARLSLSACGASSPEQMLGQACQIEIRNKMVDARIVKTPFVAKN